ncbi:MAG: replication-associated recombination protein A [Clostridia bacterium]
MENLFEQVSQAQAPLYERMRPTSINEFVGQKHIVGPNCLLNRAIKTNRLGSCIFYGPPGCGKTTLAHIIANTLNGQFVKLNAVSSGVGDAKKIIDQAKKDMELYQKRTYLLLDECHRWNKAQSDCVLEAIERGYIIFIGSTTENPNISMTPAIVSRCRLFEFKPLNNADIKDALLRALNDKTRGLGNYNAKITPDALKHFAHCSGGDLRNALNALEIAVMTTEPDANGIINVDLAVAEESIQKPTISVDETTYYNLLSAFCKSLRGSDADAAIYYSQRLICAGCDPQLIARRLIAHASEDVGMADSQALVLACCALYSIKNMGMPEANLPLTHAIIYVCEAEKSNSVVSAMDSAKVDAELNHDDMIPPYLKNHTEDSKDYKYPHNYGGYVKQQYLPDTLKDRIYYHPSKNGNEKNIKRKKLTFDDKKD